MKGLLYLLPILIVLSCSQPNNPPDKTSTVIDNLPPNAESIAYSKRAGFSSIVIKDGDGKVKEEGEMMNDQREGNWLTYHAKGDVKTVTSYVNGKKQGLFLHFNQSGQLTRKARYSNGLLHGESRKFENKKLKEIIAYENGQRNGIHATFYSNGNRLMELEFKNDVQNGMARYFDQEGELTMEYEFSNGEKVKR